MPTHQDNRFERRDRIYDFLRRHPAGVLSVVDPDGAPHGSVVYFAPDKSGALLFTTKKATKKHDAITRHDQVHLTVFDVTAQVLVQIKGIASEITGVEEAQEAFAATLHAAQKSSDASVPPISKVAAGRYIAYRFNPVEIRMTDYGNKGPASFEIKFDLLDRHELSECARR